MKVELTDENIGQMLPIYDDRRSCVGHAILALINREILTFLEFDGQLRVAFDAAFAGNRAYAMEISASSLPMRCGQHIASEVYDGRGNPHRSAEVTQQDL